MPGCGVNRPFWQFLRDAPVQSGVCMCGGSCTDHSPVDMWDHSLGKWLEAEEKLAERLDAALVRLIALENNAANLERWEQLQRELSG